MFWRFGFNNPSAVDTLLEREDVTLEEILEEDEVLQEAKSHNQKLTDFLCQPANSEKLMYYITANNLEEGQKFKYPFLCSEIIACEIPQLLDVIINERKELLETFWQFLDRTACHQNDNKNFKKEDGDGDDTAGANTQQDMDSGLESLLASYFAKTVTVFLTKQPAEMLEFIESKPGNLDKILDHLHSSAVMDLLLTLVRMEELPEGKGIVQWLSDGGLMENLVDRLDPYLDTEEHSITQQCICEIIRMSQTSLVEQPSIGLNDLIIKLKSERMMQKLAGFMLDPNAPNATSTLINGVTIIIDLIRHNNSDMENDPMLNTAYGYTGNNAMIRPASVSLAEMLKVLADHVADFNRLLTEPRSVTGPMRSSIGEQIPLGFERLKICELFAELLHCSNMSNLNAIDYQTLNHEDEKDHPTKRQDETLEHLQSEGSFMPTNDNEGDLELPATTTLPVTDETECAMMETSGTDGGHQQRLPMGDYLKLQLVEHKVLPTCTDLFFAFPWNNFLHYVTYDMFHQVFNGGMDKGHNRLLALSILKEGQLTTNMVKAQKKNDEEWAKPKGMRLGYMGHLTFIADEVIKLFEGYPEAIVQEIKGVVDLDLWYQYCENELRETKERDCLPLGGDRPNDDDGAMHEEDEEDELDGGTASQYSRYLAQREADGGLEDDEDDAHWITGRNDNVYGNVYSMMGDGHNQVSGIDDEAEYDSDEEEHDNQVITQDWSRGFTEFPQSSMLRRTQSHIEDGCDETEDDNHGHFDEAGIPPQQQQQQQQQQHQQQPAQNITNDDDNDDDPFGELVSSENGVLPIDDNTCGASTAMDQLDISTDEKNMTTVENGGVGKIMTTVTLTKSTSPRTTTVSLNLSEDNYVPAIRTKEEDERYKKEYQLGQYEEQEGEI